MPQPLILIAEDEDLMRAIVTQLPEGAGYRVAVKGAKLFPEAMFQSRQWSVHRLRWPGQAQ
jgi:CheY-like chemotaxis protein